MECIERVTEVESCLSLTVPSSHDGNIRDLCVYVSVGSAYVIIITFELFSFLFPNEYWESFFFHDVSSFLPPELGNLVRLWASASYLAR